MHDLLHLAAPAYTPFIDPIDVVWHGFRDLWVVLLIPVSLFVAMVYRAVRTRELAHYWRTTTVMTLQITFAMIGLAVFFALFVQWLLPLVAPMPGT